MQKLWYIHFFLVVVSILTVGFTHAAGSQATFSLTPATGTYQSGEEFTVALKLNTGESAATSIKAYLTFDPSLIYAVKIEKGEEFPYWWESKVEDGLIKLSASTPTPGVSGPITIANVTLRGVRPGEAAIGYDLNSIVLDAADQDLVDLVSSAKGNFAFVAGAKESSGNFLGLFFGVLSLLLGGTVVFMVWKKLHKGREG